MDQQSLQEIKMADVLLICDEEDDFFLKKYIIPELEKAKINFILPETYILAGQNRLNFIPTAIENSKKVLIVLSEKTKKKFKCTLEIFLALEKSLSTKRMCLTIALLGNLDSKDIPKIPLLEHSMTARITDNALPYTMKKVIDNIRDEGYSFDEKMPAGNLATGLAWSHFLGYLTLILPELATHIIESEWFKQSEGRMSTRFFMLLPKSGKCLPLQDQDSRIELAGNLKIEIFVAGTKRVYTPNVYKIQDEVKQTHYYCCAEIPSAFGCIGKIFHEKLGMLNSKQRNLEVDRFYHVLSQILNHENNKKCHMLYELITYNDEEKSDEGLPSTHILQRFHKQDDKTEETAVKDFKYDVCLMYGEDNQDEAHLVKNNLQSKPKKPSITEAKSPDKMNMQEVVAKVRDSKWVVLILSENQKWFEFWIAELLCCGVDQDNDAQEICVLPLLLNVTPEMLPNFIRWLTYIEAIQGEDYVSRIYEIIMGQRVALKTQSPVGNIHHGLVWGFVVNYLRHVLPQITERIKERLKELGVDLTDPNNHYHPGLLEIVPMNCEVPTALTVSKSTYKIENMGRINALKEPQQQKVIRVFACNFYRLVKGSQSYYFAGEFATPIRTLHGMGTSVICGLTADKMKKEAEQFAEKLSSIMSKDEEGHNISILRLNEKEGLDKVIIDEIKEMEDLRRTRT